MAKQITENATSTKQLFTGLGEFRVIAVNPNSQELREIYNFPEGMEVREPEYTKETEHGTSMRLDIFCKYAGFLEKNPPIVKYTIFVENRDQKNKADDKFCFINNEGRTAWAATIADIEAANDLKTEEWQKFNFEGVRKAKIGEVQFFDFIVNLYNANRKSTELCFENFAKLSQGSVKEVKEWLDSAIENEKVLLLLCGVKDGKYQDVFRSTLRVQHTAKEYSKMIEDAKGYFKSDYTEKFLPYESAQAPQAIEEESPGNPLDDEKTDLKTLF